jgi:prefoldin subunit 1
MPINKRALESDVKPPGSGPDMELKKAFMELQSKMVDTKQKLKMADLQIESLKRNITHAGLTESEIGTLPDETRVYESVGRMFILSDKQTVAGRLTDKQSSCQEKIKTLESNKEYLERNLKESENSLRELVAQKMNTAGQ